MSGENGCVTFHSCPASGRRDIALIAFGGRLPDCPDGHCDTYALGPKMAPPDYGPLVAWLKAHRTRNFHDHGCPWLTYENCTEPCTCGLTDALKAARIE